MPKGTIQIDDDPKIATTHDNVKTLMTKVDAQTTKINALQTTNHANSIATVETNQAGALAQSVAQVLAEVRKIGTGSPAPGGSSDAALIAALDAKMSTALSGIGSKVGEIGAALSGIGGQVSALAAAVAKLGAVQPPGPTPDPVPTDWPPAVEPVAGTVVRLTEGRKLASYHIEASDVSIIGAGMRKTIIDGQGGIGSGHRLAWGKGVIHISGAENLLVKGIGFYGGGGADRTHDGEAGFYNEAGTATIEDCAFDGCENGAYAQPREYNNRRYSKTIFRRCVWGRVTPNGMDPGAHDVYMGGTAAEFHDCVFVGNSKSNTIKARLNELTVTNSWIGRGNGRFIDLPGGTVLRSSGNTYVTRPGVGSNNSFGFYNEGDPGDNTDGFGDAIFDGDTFIFGGRSREVFWINHPSAKLEFRNCKVFWYGDTPPEVIFTSDSEAVANMTGWPTSPFVFDARNRIAAPPPPADPA